MKLEETLRIRLPAEVKEYLEEMAVLNDRSVGWIVRTVLEAYIEKLKAENV